VSRIEQGQMKYYLKTFDMRDLVNEVANELKENIRRCGLELKLNVTSEVCLVHDDKTKLKQVLINLVDNANKYTKKGWIEIGLQKIDGNKALFSVKDSGVGIAPDTMPLLFKKFSRAQNAGKANILGTGLGLFVAKKMMEAQNGKIWAESEGDGKGSQFYVELDLVK
jgi:signal transduction histidine kinase